MSLAAIRKLRHRGHKPAGVVRVLIGAKPRWLDDDETVVALSPSDSPNLMDWRPLTGLKVVLLSAPTTQADRIAAVVDSLEAAGAHLFGAVDERGAFPMMVGADPAFEQCLRGMWEQLCR